jgi:hypothetical protein
MYIGDSGRSCICIGDSGRSCICISVIVEGRVYVYR